MSQEIVQRTLRKLKENNVRITPQRQAVLEFMIGTHAPPTAADGYQALAGRFPNMSVATIYNNLRLFTELGLIEEMAYGDASSHFDFAQKKHYHAICDRCGKVVDIFYPGLDDVEVVAHHLTGFNVTGHRMEVHGICPECQLKQTSLID